MRAARLRYGDYEASRSEPNLVVDGAPNESTVLTLSHWPGIPAPDGLARDLSAQMAFAHLDAPVEHPPAAIVTNNHFDQDGLVGIHALVDPERSLAHRDLLIDVAAAGDFATYRDRRAARASMVLARLAAAETSCDYSEATNRLYIELLPRLLPIVLDVDAHRESWADEDAELTASETAIARGAVAIDERPEIDLAIVAIAEDEPRRSGHRFGHERFHGIHPMALHNATERFRVLLMQGRRYRFVDRYETWVQYRSRPTLPRVDLRPLAEQLTALERCAVVWRAGDPGELTPHLTHDGESTIAPVALVEQLATALAVSRFRVRRPRNRDTVEE